MDFKERFKGKMSKVDKSGVQGVLLQNQESQGIKRSNIIPRPQSDQPSGFKNNSDLYGSLQLKIGSTRFQNYNNNSNGPDTNYSVKSAQVNGYMPTPGSNNNRNSERFNFGQNSLMNLGHNNNNNNNNNNVSDYNIQFSNNNNTNNNTNNSGNYYNKKYPNNQLQRSRSDQISYRRQESSQKIIDIQNKSNNSQFPEISQQQMKNNSNVFKKKISIAQSDRKFNKDSHNPNNFSNNSSIQTPSSQNTSQQQKNNNNMLGKKGIRLSNSNILIKNNSFQKKKLSFNKMDTEGDNTPQNSQNFQIKMGQISQQKKNHRKSLDDHQYQSLIDQDQYINKLTEQCYQDMKHIQDKKQYFNGNKKYQLYHSTSAVNESTPHNNPFYSKRKESTPSHNNNNNNQNNNQITDQIQQEGYMQYFLDQNPQKPHNNNLLRQYQSYIHKTPDWSQIGVNEVGPMGGAHPNQQKQQNNPNNNNQQQNSNINISNLHSNNNLHSKIKGGFRAKDLDANYSAIHRNANNILDNNTNNNINNMQ